MIPNHITSYSRITVCHTCLRSALRCTPDKYGMPICEECLGKK